MPETTAQFPVSEDGYAFPVEDVLTGRGFVTGKSGSGKSNTASVIAEELLERGLPLLIVDTDGEYYGLKERYELLHVGADEGCDRRIAADGDDAALVAEIALEEGLPVVLDVSGFLDEDDARAVIYEVVRALFVAEKRERKPFLLLVEEAHEFVPERGSDDLSEMLIRVAKRGRKRGLGICGMSQRPAAVDKDYITQCDWLVWHRLTWDNDTAVAERILGDDAGETVRSLADGEALVLTDWDESVERVQFRRKRTLDAGGTPDLDALETDPADRSRLVAEYSDGDGTTVLPTARVEGTSEAERSTTAAERDEGSNRPSGDDSLERTPASGAPDSTGTNGRGTDASETVEPEAGEGTDDYDPVWELAYAIVHLAGVVASAHRGAVRRLEGEISRSRRDWRRSGLPETTAEFETAAGGRDATPTDDAGDRPMDDAGDRPVVAPVDPVARYLSRVFVVAAYAAVVLTVVALL